jgi:hypothetical protein
MINYTYKNIEDYDGNIRTDVILRVEDNAVIPKDTANTDYKMYLEQLT